MSVIAMIQVSAGWLTYGQPCPQGQVWGDLQLQDQFLEWLPTQVDVQCRWPDGSTKFAVVTAKIPSEGPYQLRTGVRWDATFQSNPMPSLWVWLRIGQRNYYAQWIDSMAEDSWYLNGGHCLENRCRVPFYADDGSNSQHPFLYCVLDAREYSDGTWRFSVCVENCLDQAGGLVRYDAYLGVGEEILWQGQGLEHYYLTCWRQVFWLNQDGSVATVSATLVPDLASAVAAKAIPAYSPEIVTRVDRVDFWPGSPGLLNPIMWEHGGRQELAPYPDWAARYLAHRDPRQLDCMLTHGDLAGSWPIHVRNGDGTHISIDERPDYWITWSGGYAEDGPAGRMDQTGPLEPDIAHQPSLAYLPWLLTGDRHYADEVADWADFCLLGVYAAARTPKGYLHAEQVRGFAWALRNLADAAAWLPDDDPRKGYFAEKVANNLEWLNWAAADAQGPLRILWHWKRPENNSEWFSGGVVSFQRREFYAVQQQQKYGKMPTWFAEAAQQDRHSNGVDLNSLNEYCWIALWEQNYLAWAIDHANEQGFVGGLDHLRLIVELQHSLFHNARTRDGAAPYLVPVGTQNPPGSGNVSWFRTLQDLYVGPSQFAGYYGVDARLSLMLAEKLGLPNAAEHRAWLESQPGMWAFLAEGEGGFGPGWFVEPTGVTRWLTG